MDICKGMCPREFIKSLNHRNVVQSVSQGESPAEM